ncbi:MAG: restriction endonuclease [Tepidisphaera sp.]
MPVVVPPYQQFMLPVLRSLADGIERRLSQVAERTAGAMGLSEEQKGLTIPSGQEMWYNRLSWAAIYLNRAGLVVRPRKGVYKLTSLGVQVLGQNPPEINNTFLMQFEGFREFLERGASDPAASSPTSVSESAVVQSPDEQLDSAFKKLQSALAAELLDRVRSGSPKFFEQVVVDLLMAMGYGGEREGAGTVTGRTGDGGIDGTINQDRLGLDIVYVQAKRWADSVGEDPVRSFAGALGVHRASKGVFVTTSKFTIAARDFAKMSDKRIILIDGQRLAELMIEHGIGVSPVRKLVISEIDSDYFEE